MTFPQPDPRMAYFSGGLGPDGVPIPISAERLQETAGRWPTTDTTPSGVADLLRVSRSLFVYSCFVYDFATPSAWHGRCSR